MESDISFIFSQLVSSFYFYSNNFVENKIPFILYFNLAHGKYLKSYCKASEKYLALIVALNYFG